MKLMPRSMQMSIWRVASARSVSPTLAQWPAPPKVMVPSVRAETLSPELPSWRYSMPASESGDVAASQQRRGDRREQPAEDDQHGERLAGRDERPAERARPAGADRLGRRAERSGERVAVGAQEDVGQRLECAHAVRERAEQTLDDERVEDPDADRQ